MAPNDKTCIVVEVPCQPQDLIYNSSDDEFLDKIKYNLLKYTHIVESDIINSIKYLRKSINLSIPDNAIKLHLIFEAEKLCYPNQESANALLKILEEPKKNNLFILITSDINKIIDTILSRCTRIFFPDIEPKLIKDKLIEKNQLFGLESNIDFLHVSNIDIYKKLNIK